MGNGLYAYSFSRLSDSLIFRNIQRELSISPTSCGIAAGALHECLLKKDESPHRVYHVAFGNLFELIAQRQIC